MSLLDNTVHPYDVYSLLTSLFQSAGVIVSGKRWEPRVHMWSYVLHMWSYVLLMYYKE